ncbi:RIP metalloprotease RseP [Falsigemmobacter intermedius]|uniref:Zinc metalloprotease n=1 Tax=Falsigemmobacter intermedius TaxID=1553448 RepID=A0A444M9J0_9RHOB|nr:RIP metalloprotease RseP [Falsigemmobacter intermedius]RWY39600.1 RIP metalloprotease RseP [Falsigemmobacter intermedius]
MEFFAQFPDFGGGLRTLVAFVGALSVIVAIHEYGHYIVGRWCGIKADVFSLGFGPVVFSRVDRHGTRWQIAALPLGGFVKFKGDADAASGRDEEVMAALSPEAARDTMHGAPLWARAATVAAGPVFNFVFSILIFAGIAISIGIATDEARIGQVKPMPGAERLQEGDLITALNGAAVKDLRDFATIATELPAAPFADYTLERAGRVMQVEGPFPFPPLADQVNPDSPAQDAGLIAGDVILSVDGTPISSFTELREAVALAGGSEVALQIWRAGALLDVSLTPKRMDVPRAEGGFETRWLIGVTGGLAFVPETRNAGPVEALQIGVSQVGSIIKTSLSGMWHMVTGAISSCNLRGPLGIAQSSGNAAAQGSFTFIWFIGMLSTAVGLMNLFPVPVLDGGHLVFHAWEAVTGKPPSDRALRGLMTAGLTILLSLMVFALTNDLFCP